MALGAYGIKRPADVSPEDVDIVMVYTPTREANSGVVVKSLDANAILAPYYHNGNTSGNANVEILGGLYNLKLPSSEFDKKGIYTVYIKPIEIRTSITDCGVLSSLPNVKGLVFDLNNVDSQFRNRFVNNGLVGFRVEYLNSDGTKIPNFYRIVTSSFFCEPVTQNLTNSSQKAIRYRYVNGGSNLLFCTLTPTSAPTNKPSALPYIGQPDQNVIITNTYFNPITLDIEMVDYDVESLGIALYGNQSKSLSDGIYTLYDADNNIYKQYTLYEKRDQFGTPLYEVRKDKGNNIDFSKAFSNIE
tara:strand:- start:4818 stop:5723 length:906 start_codon:yes stop_codon:yes gene_type:complete